MLQYVTTCSLTTDISTIIMHNHFHTTQIVSSLKYFHRNDGQNDVRQPHKLIELITGVAKLCRKPRKLVFVWVWHISSRSSKWPFRALAKKAHTLTHTPKEMFSANEENAPYKTKHLDGTALWYNLNKPTTIIIIYGMLWRRYRQCFWFLVLNFDSIQYQDTDKLHLVLTWKFFPLLLLLSNDLL